MFSNMNIFTGSQELVNLVKQEIGVCADMIGKRDPNKETQYGFVPGLDMLGAETELRKKIENIEKGIFQVMFTGCFSSGKSTLLNALMRRDVLKTGPVPETAVITKLFFNAPEEKIVIYKRNEIDEFGNMVTEVTRDFPEFFKKYRVDRKDTTKFMKLVHHVEMYFTTPGIAGSMVQLVDSPGTKATAADNAVSRSFVKQANAVVFLISAVVAMDEDDRKYIADQFAKRQMKNVFFVINRANQLNSDEQREEVRQYVKDELKDTFLDADGTFDEYLYDKRVFFVNAFGSLNTRLGQVTPSEGGERYISDDITGVPEFEAALSEFLTSGNKDKEALSAYRSQMASVFKIAEKTVADQLNILEKGRAEIERDKRAFEQDKEKIIRELKHIREDIAGAELEIINHSKEIYDKFLNAISAEWEGYFSDKTDDMGISYSTILWAKLKEKFFIWKDDRQSEAEAAMQEATKAFVDGIMQFVQEKHSDLMKEFAVQLEEDVNRLSRKLEDHQKLLDTLNIPVNIEEIMEAIALEKNIAIGETTTNKVNMSQVFLTLLIGGIDPEVLIMATEGRANMKEFFIKLVKANIIDLLVVNIAVILIGNIFSIVAFIVYKSIVTVMAKSSATEKLIMKTKVALLDGETDANGNRIPGLRTEGRQEYINKINSVIGAAMRRTGAELTNGIQAKIDEIGGNLESSIKMLKDNQNAYVSEKERARKILDKMVDSISEISILTNNQPLNREDIIKLASVTNWR